MSLPGRCALGEADELYKLSLAPKQPAKQVRQLASKRVGLWCSKKKRLSGDIFAMKYFKEVTEKFFCSCVALNCGSCGRLKAGTGAPVCVKNEGMSVSDHSKSHSVWGGNKSAYEP